MPQRNGTGVVTVITLPEHAVPGRCHYKIRTWLQHHFRELCTDMEATKAIPRAKPWSHTPVVSSGTDHVVLLIVPASTPAGILPPFTELTVPVSAANVVQVGASEITTQVLAMSKRKRTDLSDCGPVPDELKMFEIPGIADRSEFDTDPQAAGWTASNSDSGDESVAAA